MAVRGQEVEILTGGTDSRTPSNDTFVLNMIKRRGAWEVRDGFGQICQRSTSLSMPTIDTMATQEWGIERHLGSHLMETNQGHLQIISVFVARVNSANTDGREGLVFPVDVRPNNFPKRIYTVQIDDLTDGTHWEEALYRHTSGNHSDLSASSAAQKNFGVPMHRWHGHYETFEDVNRQAWVSAEDARGFFFYEFRDTLFFGNEDVGTWVYYPTHFRDSKKKRHAYVDTHLKNEYGQAYSESSRVQELTFMPGFGKNYPYFTSADLPGFVDMVAVGPIAVYASGRKLFFADPELPGSIIDINFQSVPSEGEITALEEQFGNVLVFTEKETFVYRFPGNTLSQSGGQFTQISNHIGCINASSVIKVDGRVVWADRNGVYSTTGNFSIQDIGAPIERFFTDYMTNPLTSFYTDSGTTVTSNTQPATTLQADLSLAHLAYCPKFDAVMLTFPGNNASLVFSSGEWSVWTNESIAFVNAGSPEVGLTSFIQNPWVVSNQDRIFMVGSDDTQLIVDDSSRASNVLSNSYYLMEYGRGGNIDRSVDDEDERRPTGFWEYDATLAPAPAANTFIYYGEPVRVDQGYKFRGAQPTVTESDEIYLIPVSIVVPETGFSGVGVTTIVSYMNFDNNNWAPVLISPVGTDVDFMVHSERNETSWGYGAGAVGSQVRWVGGNLIELEFSSTVAGGAEINASPQRVTPLLWLPFRKTSSTNSTYGLSLQPVQAFQTITSSTPTTAIPLVYVWRQHYIGTDDARREDSVSQPVDWAYKSAHVGIDGDALLKARGLFTRLLSRGPGMAADFAVGSWNFGLYNTLLASDRKGWISQVIDYNGINADAIDDIASKSTIRTRVSDAGTLVTKVFNTAGLGRLFYGGSGTADGNYLIDDEETSVIATSDSTKGEMFSYMLFGHIQVRSQKIKLESVRALIRPLGDGRRRKGH